jgi:hypothetical protein
MTGAMSRVTTINPNLPGGNNGIRDVSQILEWNDLPGYTRQRLLQTIQDELRTLQDKFTGKLIQIGFFPAKDTDHTLELWRWLFHDASNDVDANGVHLVALGDEFNGIRRPRVSFFQENLAATRTLTPSGFDSSSAPNYITPASTTAYTFTPISSVVPSFAYYTAPTNDQYRNGNTWQANTPWSNAFAATDGIKLIRTINGSPNDGMEAGFNNYLSQYLEIYPGDVDEAAPLSGLPTLNAELWAGQLQSWKAYTDSRRNLAPIEAPAGLSVVRNLDNTNTVTWYAVYAPVDPANPVKYTVNRKNVTGSGWTNVCNLITDTVCHDTNTSTGSAYAYQVRASKAANTTPYAYVAGFLSEGNKDGYVPATGQPVSNAPQPGILAGQDVNGVEVRGILSFSNGSLSMSKILTAKLRLDQANATGVAFEALGPCFVDVATGFFGNSAALEAPADFNDMTDVSTKVAQIIPFIPPPDGIPAWVEAYLDATGVSEVNTSSNGRTQFRIYFNDVPITNTFGTWYSGEANIAPNSVPPQLIVQYTP